LRDRSLNIGLNIRNIQIVCTIHLLCFLFVVAGVIAYVFQFRHQIEKAAMEKAVTEYRALMENKTNSPAKKS
jgi:hypothetical protein